jgi:hypothetical protein
MLRLALVAVVALVLAPSATAWSWPCEGAVLRPFSLVDDPYAAGQHRGIDVGCGAGTSVGAPASGAVTFAGSLPGMGRGVTIQTADGYAVTLVQLRATSVSRGDAVDEGATIGAVGESEDPVTRAPHVHLGVRVASDPHGYVDPLSLLPRRPASVPPASVAPPPAALAQPATMPAAPVAPPAAQAPAVAAPAPPTATVAAASPQPVAAVAVATTSAEPVKAADPVAPTEAEAAPVSTTADEGSAGGLEVTARASERSVGTEPATAGDVSSRRFADAPSGVVGPRLATPAAVDARDASSAWSGNARTASAHALHAESPPSPPEPRVEATTGQLVVAGEPRESILRPATTGGSGRLARWWLVASLVAAAGAVALGAARIMTARVREPVPAEDPGRAGVAVCERAAPHRACRGVRGPRGHLRAVPPPPGQRRPHGVRDGRARDAGDGHGGQGRALAA